MNVILINGKWYIEKAKEKKYVKISLVSYWLQIASAFVAGCLITFILK